MAETSSPTTHTDILLESGTNELEVLVFTVGSSSFGVNVAKVREVITPTPVIASPHQPKSVVGMFDLRGKILPLVDLHDYLDIAPLDEDPRNRRIIITEFNGINAGFRVESVEQIYRMSWKHMRPVPEVDEGAQSHLAVTGITEINERLILMLDFESIIDHISVQDTLHVTQVENKLGIDRSQVRVVVAEDSRFIRDIIEKVLRGSGFVHVNAYDNGQAAHDAIMAVANDPEQRPHVLVSDIEMPRMDGLALTRSIREHSVLQDIPVILFSSLVTDDTRHKGEQVGANEQIAKPQIPEMVNLIDKWIHKGQQEAA